ncbi:proton-conducting transporter transmembrane domain-containing protein [Orientia tsutsugamushi]|uniref:NADH-Ubiquinone/plastoquinone (Complex I), various chains family protein n=2 Tax=Orientia tsutsugamushi TaxID=784 RepID=A0A0F3RMY1_ORITS|nr:proton-conducting transporter membrane subunit [Orientia tsutsugamushi]KJV57591.1 NADH-Ubiquinone/plastoquinone (complex I), various chains family protein [Orientia tsutsugamushi str. Karp]KJW07608.1 NADH-Ubiquinone/plastoquinone (complex I), various chains family protein [Orientia tsutsugamushi str. UT144]SPR15135.1 cation:proton antiporter [Orientia tsutsugamushi]
MSNIFQAVKDHLVILEVLIPFFGSLIVVLYKKVESALIVSRLCAILGIILGIYGVLSMINSPPYFYAIGNWQAPIGIEYRVDQVNQIIIVFSYFILFLLLTFNSQLIKTNLLSSLNPSRSHLLYSILLLLHTGFCGIILSNDLFNIYVFIEIASLASYTLVSQGVDKRALIGSINYLILGTIGATFILIAIGFILSNTGSLNITDIISRLPQQRTKTLIAAIMFYITGCLLKVAMFPMSSWLISTYKYTSSVILSYFAPISCMVGFYILLYFVYQIIGITNINTLHSYYIINALGLAGAIFCSCYAVQQSNLKSIMAYSVLAETSYISLMAFNIQSSTIGAQIIVILLTSCILKSIIYSLISRIEVHYHDSELKHIAGIGSTYPVFGILFTLALISNLGLPLTIGFVNKLNIFLTVLQSLGYFGIIILAISSCMSFNYHYKIFHYLYSTQQTSHSSFTLNGNNSVAIILTIISYLMLIFYNHLLVYLKPFFLPKIM